MPGPLPIHRLATAAVLTAATCGFAALALAAGPGDAGNVPGLSLLALPSASIARPVLAPALGPAAPSTATEDLLWSINLQPGDTGYDLRQARQAFRAIRGLGARAVRTDVAWGDLEPTPGAWNVDRERWYRAYLALAREEGLEPIVILYGGSRPEDSGR